jgi:hypothetical protein
MDTAITPVTNHDVDTYEMFQSEAARAYVGQERRLQEIRGGHAQPAAADAERAPERLAG